MLGVNQNGTTERNNLQKRPRHICNESFLQSGETFRLLFCHLRWGQKYYKFKQSNETDNNLEHCQCSLINCSYWQGIDSIVNVREMGCLQFYMQKVSSHLLNERGYYLFFKPLFDKVSPIKITRSICQGSPGQEGSPSFRHTDKISTWWRSNCLKALSDVSTWSGFVHFADDSSQQKDRFLK